MVKLFLNYSIGGEVSPEVSLESSSTYIAAIDVANSSYFGEWELNVSSPGSVMASAASDLGFRYVLVQLDSNSALGVSRSTGNPVAGIHLAILLLPRYCVCVVFNQCSCYSHISL